MRYDCVLNYRKMHGIIMGKNVYNGKKYVRESLQVAMGTFLLELLVLQLLQYHVFLAPILTGLCFFLIVEVVVGIIWGHIYQNQVEVKASFLMGVSGFRFLVALLVIFIYFLATGRSAMMPFLLLFVPYYFAMLVQHLLFFTHVNKLA